MSFIKQLKTGKSSHARKSITGILLCLLVSAAGLAIPLIYYMITFAPVLTDDLLSELSFVSYLCANGSHTFCAGWTSTGEFVPFGVRFFLTFFYTTLDAWQNALSSAVFASYGLFAVSFLFFVYTIRAKHIPTFIICFLSAAFLGQFSLQGTYYCNNLITYLTFLFIILGLLMQGIRCRLKLPTAAQIPLRILISALCAVPVIFLCRYVGTLSAEYSFRTVSPNISEIKKQLNVPLFAKPSATADLSDITGLEKYLEDSGNTLIYCDTEITERMYFISGGKYNTATVKALDDLTKVSAPDCPENLYDSLSVNTFPLYVAVSNINLPEYEDSQITFFADVCYSDDYYTVLRYTSSDYYYDTDLRTDIMALKENSYDTVFLSMYDIDTYDPEEVNTFMAWDSLFTAKTFSDFSYWKMYTDIIFAGNNDSMPAASDGADESDDAKEEPSPNIKHCLLGIDPEMIYHLAGDDSDKMILLLDNTIEKTVKENCYTDFLFIFPGYEASHYAGYTRKDFDGLTESYKIFTNVFDEYENVSYNYTGDAEWLYSNPYIFEPGSDCMLESGVAYTVMGHILAGDYQVDSDALKERILSFTETINDYNSGNTFSYELSDTSIVILGDSIFGLFQNNSSIQAILSNYSKAYVDCRAIGGASASYETELCISLAHQFDASDINQKLADNNADDNRLVFIIEFGLNDYFSEYPADNAQNPYDKFTYSGALRLAIEEIKSIWPESEILIISPGYISDSEESSKRTGDGCKLQDYRDIAKALSEEYQTMFLDLTQIGITPGNLSEYSGDLVHYNESGRMLIAREIVTLLNSENY